MAVFIPITGMKAEGSGRVGGEQAVAANQRRQLTVFTASTFSTIQPSTPPQSSGRGRKRSCPMKTELSVTSGFNGELQGLPPAALKQKIPRPPNAFMLFANDWRRKLASQFPKESNKDISIRLGGMWKNMEKDEKEKYFQYAREVDAAHKKKYPDYVYNPKEARMRKALREQSRGERQGGGPAGSAQHRGGGGPAPWSKHRQIMNHRQPIMVGEQPLHHSHHHQSHRDDCKLDSSGGMLQNFNDYLSDLSYPVAQPSEFIVPDLEQSWYSYIQGPVQNAATYLMRAPSDKVITSNEWGTHFAADNTAYIHTNSQNANGTGSGGFLGSASIGSREQQQQLVNGSATGCQTPTLHHISSPVPDDKTIILHDQTNSNDIKGGVLSENKSLLELTQIKVEGQNVIDSNGSNKDVLRLPGFQQAFGSTEIGRFSQHEGFFESSLPQPEVQPETKSIPDPVTPPRNKLPDVDFQNPGSYILSPSTNMSPSMWSPLLYSPSTMKDGTSSSCFGSPTFPQQSPLTNFIDYSLLSGTEFMQTNSDEVINISSHCSTNHSSNSGSNSLYSPEDKDLQILLATDTNCGNDGTGNNTCGGSPFGNAIKPLERITDIDNDSTDKAPGMLELCSRAQISQRESHSNNNGSNSHNNNLNNNNNNNSNNLIKNLYHQNRIKSAEEFADQDLKMNCVNQPPVIISENEKICVILESSNVSLGSCNASSTAANNKQFTNL